MNEEHWKPSLAVTFLWLTLFAVAFAWIESAVVHYLRLHFYPGGFGFPLAEWDMHTVLVEAGREICTIILLASIAFFAAKGWWRRFAYFMYVFGVWDIFYYVWLYVFEGWPESLLTPDLLFLVPVPWVGPVLAPALVSVFLILSAILIVWAEERSGRRFSTNILQVLLVLAAWVVILASFMFDALRVIETGDAGLYHWEIFLPGLFLWATALSLGVIRQGN